MIKKIVLELTYFSIILVLLASLMHRDLLVSPLLRFEHMQANGNYLHPFIWSFLLYLIIAIFRVVVKKILKFKNRS